MSGQQASAYEATGTRPATGRVEELLELTSARGFAACAVVLFHVDRYSGEPLGRWFPVSSLGVLAVDFFFVLSGFVLAHVYGAALSAGTYSHRDFLVRRLARIWPLHAACLVGVGAIVGAGSLVGLRPPWEMEPGSFFAHLFLLNATGVSPHLSWNQPAWSVGAEWSAYLLFPLYVALCSRIGPNWAKLAAAAAMLVALWALVKAAFGLELLALNANGGVLRIIPSFFAGIALRQIFGRQVGFGLTRPVLTAGLALVVAAGLAALYLRAPSVVVWAFLPALIYLLALRARQPQAGVLRARPLVWLGEVSYALYLVHALVLMVSYSLVKRLINSQDPSLLLGVGAISLVVAIGAAAVAHYVVERPAQRFILKGAWLRRRASASRLA